MFVRTVRKLQSSPTTAAVTGIATSASRKRGTDLKTIQMLLGHVDLEATTIYLHLSQRHLQSMTNPVDALPIAGLGEKPRLRRAKGE